ncbi:MAG: hypothetical protein V3W41_02755 [Planctomycetota bacterium]
MIRVLIYSMAFSAFLIFPAVSQTFPGNGPELQLSTGVNGVATLFPDTKPISGGDLLTVEIDHLNLNPIGFAFFLVAELRFNTPTSAMGPAPGAWVASGSGSTIAIFDSTVLLGPPTLPLGGITFAWQLPPSIISGLHVILQAVVVAPNAPNFVYLSNAQELLF